MAPNGVPFTEKEAALCLILLRRGGAHIKTEVLQLDSDGYSNYDEYRQCPDNKLILENLYVSSAEVQSMSLRAHLEPPRKKFCKRYEEQLKSQSWASIYKETREVGTQTDYESELNQITELEDTIRLLSTKVLELQQKFDLTCPKTEVQLEKSNAEKRKPLLVQRVTAGNVKIEPKNIKKKSMSSSEFETTDDDSNYSAESTDYSDESFVESMPKENLAQRKIVPIGDGYAKIPSSILTRLEQTNWTKPSYCTRALLTAVFPRAVLATHCLSGKPSPAFPNKPPKKPLDAAKISDIITFVMQKCNVKEAEIRSHITTKCADESKMLRSRKKKEEKSKLFNKENVFPRDPMPSFNSSI